MTGTSSRTARVPPARRDLKEAAGKTPAQVTQTVCEAFIRGRGSVGAQSPMSSGTGGRICGGRGAKVTRLTLGDLHSRRSMMANLIERCGDDVQKSAEGIRGRSSDQRPEQTNPGPMLRSR
jgi:hypothetical protein